MTATWNVIFLVLAFLLFLAAGLKWPASSPQSRFDLGWLGLAVLTLALWLRVA